LSFGNFSPLTQPGLLLLRPQLHGLSFSALAWFLSKRYLKFKNFTVRAKRK